MRALDRSGGGKGSELGVAAINLEGLLERGKEHDGYLPIVDQSMGDKKVGRLHVSVKCLAALQRIRDELDGKAPRGGGGGGGRGGDAAKYAMETTLGSLTLLGKRRAAWVQLWAEVAGAQVPSAAVAVEGSTPLAVDFRHTFDFAVGSAAREELITLLHGTDSGAASLTVRLYSLTSQQQRNAPKAGEAGARPEGTLLGLGRLPLQDLSTRAGSRRRSRSSCSRTTATPPPPAASR